MADEQSYRYPVSKLLQLFAIREIAARSDSQIPWITINIVDPGLCYTDISRNAEGSTYWGMKIMRALLAWTAEEGSRTLVHAASLGRESHGIYISRCRIEKYVGDHLPWASQANRLTVMIVIRFQVWSLARKEDRRRGRFGGSWQRSLRLYKPVSQMGSRIYLTKRESDVSVLGNLRNECDIKSAAGASEDKTLIYHTHPAYC